VIQGCDVSVYQGDVDWAAVTAAFVIIRATFGTSGVDAQFARNLAGARGRGIPRGFYHFAEGDAPDAEAQHFLDTVGPLQPGETLWLDDETALPERNVWAGSFIDMLRPKVRIPGLYSNYSGFRRIGVVPGVVVWIAFPALPPLAPPAGYASAPLNQTSVGRLPGIPANVDIDYLLANDIAVFTGWGAPEPDPPSPPPPPDEEDAVKVIFVATAKAGQFAGQNVECVSEGGWWRWIESEDEYNAIINVTGPEGSANNTPPRIHGAGGPDEGKPVALLGAFGAPQNAVSATMFALPFP